MQPMVWLWVPAFAGTTLLLHQGSCRIARLASSELRAYFINSFASAIYIGSETGSLAALAAIGCEA